MFETGRENSSKISTVLYHRQVQFLDQMAINLRLRHGVPMLRAEIVYAVIEAAIRSGVDLSEAAGEHEITELMLGEIRGRSGTRCSKNRLHLRHRKQ